LKWRNRHGWRKGWSPEFSLKNLPKIEANSKFSALAFRDQEPLRLVAFLPKPLVDNAALFFLLEDMLC
jgi:hypothetical protein